MSIEEKLKKLSSLKTKMPDKDMQKQILNRASQHFKENHEKNLHKTQGSPWWHRLTSRINTLLGGIDMNIKNITKISVAVASVMLVLVLYKGTLQDQESTTLVDNKLDTKVEQPKEEVKIAQNTPIPADDKYDIRTSPVIKPQPQAARKNAEQEESDLTHHLDAEVSGLQRAPSINRVYKRQQKPSPSTFAGSMAGKAAPSEGYAVGSRPHLWHSQIQNNDKFEDFAQNTVKLVSEHPVSTFSIDVDTSSYTVARKSIQQGSLPSTESVRAEEFINYFDYDYAPATSKKEPFRPTVAVYPTPWNKNTKLVHIGIKGHQITGKKPASNLVFLIDTSGSMNQQDKLPLLKSSFRLLLNTLRDDDLVSIVAYAGSAGQVLAPTKVKEKSKIFAALDNLSAGGSTAGGQGIELAYQLANENFNKDAVNRVILATDGDFNVGIYDPDELEKVIKKKRDSGIYLSVLGFGSGNYNDHIMQKLAQNGNGNAAYIDSLTEAQKVLVEEASSTLYPIAKDVKIQVEFNPSRVAEYRLIGYETRALKREDFNNDKIDAGDIGSGHTVTAIYEISEVGSQGRSVDPSRYEKTKKETKPEATHGDEYAFLKMRYKLPDSDKSNLITTPITDKAFVESPSKDMKFAAAVAGFAQLLKKSEHTQNYSYDDVIKQAQSGKGEDPFGYQAEFINLVRLAKALDTSK